MFFSPFLPNTPRCYAHLLGGCSNRISGEHVFTKAIMGEGNITLVGHPGIPDHKTIGINSAVSNILCTSHNSILSILDDEAVKLSKALDDFHASTSGEFSIKIKGLIFERWLLKGVMGRLAAGQTPLGRTYPSNPAIVGALFGIIPLPNPMGMSSMVGVGRMQFHTKETLFRELLAVDPAGQSHIVGAFVTLHGIPFMFSFDGPFPVSDYLKTPDGDSYLDPYDSKNATLRFHPADLILSENGKRRLTVIFDWENPERRPEARHQPLL